MSKKSRFPQSPRHVLIYDEDWEYLETRFGSAGLKPVGVSNVIRALIHQKVLDWRNAEDTAADTKRREVIQRESMKEQSNVNPTDINRPNGSTA